MAYRISRQEWARILGETVKQCRLELARAGHFSKGGRVPANLLRECVRRTLQEKKRMIYAGKT